MTVGNLKFLIIQFGQKMCFIVAELELVAKQTSVCIRSSIYVKVLYFHLIITFQTCLSKKKSVNIPVRG